jgi:hypothetical protein
MANLPFEDFVSANLGLRRPFIRDFAPPTGAYKSSKAAGVRGSHFLDLSTNFLYEKTGENNDVDWVQVSYLGQPRDFSAGENYNIQFNRLGHLSGSDNFIYHYDDDLISGQNAFFDALEAKDATIGNDLFVSGDLYVSGKSYVTEVLDYTINGDISGKNFVADKVYIKGLDVDASIYDISGTTAASVSDLYYRFNEVSDGFENLSGMSAASIAQFETQIYGISSNFSEINDNIDTLSGTSAASIAELSQDLYKIKNGAAGIGGGASLGFAFFSKVENNTGPATNHYYSTPTAHTHLSGVTVDEASNLKVYLRWDGPGDDYIGSGFINGQRIPDNQIVELGQFTRRFEGYIDNFSSVGDQFITGEANGVYSEISLKELGRGPTPIDLTFDNLSSVTPKAGTIAGNAALKGGDIINLNATFSTSDVDTIEIYNSGISDGISAQSYQLTDNNDGTHTAIIPIEVTNSRAGIHKVSLIAKNAFGTFGEDFQSSNSFLLDQTYPNISVSSPSSYNGRSDGLREGEQTTFVNSISNWSSSSDTISYDNPDGNLTIQNPSVYQNPKIVEYANGIFSVSNNLNISVERLSNGSVDQASVQIKIANGPVINSVSLDSLATSASSPNLIGSSEVKGGDIVNSQVNIEGNGVSASNIQISVSNSGASNGSQTSYRSYSYVTESDGTYTYTVPINVTSSNSRDGLQGITVSAKNNYGTISDSKSSANTALVNNSIYPSISISNVSYPASQQALKDNESAVISNVVSNYDSVIYSSDNGQLAINQSSTYETSKTVSRSSGSYNISSNNFKITATKNSNGRVVSRSGLVKIAHIPLSLSITNLSSKLSSSASGLSDNFNLVSSQKLLSSPSLSVDPSQVSPSELAITSSGTNTNSNSYRITVKDSDTKGQFNWQVSATNLAGIVTNSISSNSSYTLEGFQSRQIDCPPTSLGAGLAFIGTTVSNTSNVSMENISEGGSGPNGGTNYSYQLYADGLQLDNSYDIDNHFAICNSNGITNSQGDYIFNLDKLNRSANTSTSNPAKFIVKES